MDANKVRRLTDAFEASTLAESATVEEECISHISEVACSLSQFGTFELRAIHTKWLVSEFVRALNIANEKCDAITPPPLSETGFR